MTHSVPELFQSPLAKIEVLNLAASLMAQSHESGVIASMGRHVLALARYDHDWDVRDRSRLLSGLLRGCSSTQPPEALASEDDMGGVILRPEQIQLVLCGRTRPSRKTEKGQYCCHLCCLHGFSFDFPPIHLAISRDRSDKSRAPYRIPSRPRK